MLSSYTAFSGGGGVPGEGLQKLNLFFYEFSNL